MNFGPRRSITAVALSVFKNFKAKSAAFVQHLSSILRKFRNPPQHLASCKAFIYTRMVRKIRTNQFVDYIYQNGLVQCSTQRKQKVASSMFSFENDREIFTSKPERERSGKTVFDKFSNTGVTSNTSHSAIHPRH